jgi:predicted nucleic acid-binding protein
MKYLIDAYSWIEYLEGSIKGEKVNKIINSEEIFVLPITIAEVVSKIKRKMGNEKIAYESIVKKAKLINMTPRIAKEAGLLHAEMRSKIPQFGIVDSIIITTAREINAKILTGDHHFKHFPETVFL